MRLLAPALVAIAAVACGDNVRIAEPYEAASGSRLKLQYYLYEDGAEEWDTRAFYDARLHTHCTQARWSDGVVRCVPDADDAVYTDADCTLVIGRGATISRPTYFVGYDLVGGKLLPARVFRAGPKTAAVAQLYERQDGECRGPFVNPLEGIQHYELLGELAGPDLVVLDDSELGEGRLGLHIRTTADGLRIPIGLHDRELDIACGPAVQADGSIACEPIDLATATLFGDHTCSVPVVAVGLADPPPLVAKVADPEGCRHSYHTVDDEVVPPLYRRDRDSCVRAAVPSSQRWFAVGTHIEPPVIGRTIERVAGRRLQRTIVHADELHVVRDGLFDTATRTECQRASDGMVSRCIPAGAATATRLFSTGCIVEVRVAELPDRACDRPTFAVAITEQGLDVHVVAAPHQGALYLPDEGGRCVRYTSPRGVVAHSLGPPIPADTFVGALTYSDR